jgi:RNA polymerase sigma factor (sigma-70 family)
MGVCAFEAMLTENLRERSRDGMFATTEIRIPEPRNGASFLTNTPSHEHFTAVVMPHLDDAYALARWLSGNRADAEDIVQDACLRALRGLDRYSGGNARAWLLAITRNAAFTWLARNRPKALVVTEDIEALAPADGAPSPEEALIATADAAGIERAIEALPPPFKETLVLRDINGLSYREIAEITGVPSGTVMSRLARARGLLMAALGRPETK